MTAPTPVERFAALPVDTQELLLGIADLLPAARRRTDLEPCGTWAAYKRHHRSDEEPCEACREASRQRDRDRRPLAQGRAS